MADAEKKIIIDDDWKAEAQREKEKLAEDADKPKPTASEAGFSELVNLIAMQALAGLGLMAGPGGERIPPNPEMAKHFIDMLQVLDDKTKGNLTDEEAKLLDQVLYETRMRYVQMSGGAGAAPPPMGA